MTIKNTLSKDFKNLSMQLSMTFEVKLHVIIILRLYCVMIHFDKIRFGLKGYKK
jgi:hypothetical protein